MPPAMINLCCKGYFLWISLHNPNPQIIAVSVMSIPYRIALISKATFCDPVEKPVPTKNKDNPRFLKALRYWSEIELFLKVFLKPYPTISPAINVQAVVPNDRVEILILPRIFPKRAVKLIIINLGYILLFISCCCEIDLELSVHLLANNCTKNTTSVTPNRYEHPYPITAFSLPLQIRSQTLDNPGVLVNAPHRMPSREA